MSRLHVLQVTATEAPTAEPTTQTPEGATDIYIGKGRYVKDDPKKYPAKDDLGPFMGATGATATTHLWMHSLQTGTCSTPFDHLVLQLHLAGACMCWATCMCC